MISSKTYVYERQVEEKKSLKEGKIIISTPTLVFFWDKKGNYSQIGASKWRWTQRLALVTITSSKRSSESKYKKAFMCIILNHIVCLAFLTKTNRIKLLKDDRTKKRLFSSCHVPLHFIGAHLVLSVDVCRNLQDWSLLPKSLTPKNYPQEVRVRLTATL